MRIPRFVIEGIAKVVSQDQAQYNLTGIHVERVSVEKIRLDATDGCRALSVVIEDDSGSSEFDEILRTEPLVGFAKLIKPGEGKKRQQWVELGLCSTNGHVGDVRVSIGSKIEQDDSATYLTPIQGSFLKMESINPKAHEKCEKGKGRKYAAICVNPEILADTLKSMSKACPLTDTHKGVVLYVPLDGQSPIQIDSGYIKDRGIEARAIVMPLRSTGDIGDNCFDRPVKEKK